MNRENIEHEVRRLHNEIWKNRHLLWPDEQRTPIQMLCPDVAAHILGVKYEEWPSLGGAQFGFRGQKFVTAGLIDRRANKIAVSTEFSPEIVRFTAGHEIGHWILHPNEVMHRDRPLDGSSLRGTRNPAERDADCFSACFYMPTQLVVVRFYALFGVNVPLIFDEATCFHLCPGDYESLLRAEEDSLEREYAIARCVNFNGQHFYSLANQFRLSLSAMAIRIKELKLIRWP